MNGQPIPVPLNRKTRRLKTIALISAGLIVVYFTYRYALARSIQTRIDAIHRAGFPATCAELNAWYVQPSPGQNAADIYTQAFAHFEMWTNDDIHFVSPPDANDTNRFYSPPKNGRDLLPLVGTAKLPPHYGPLPEEQQKPLSEYLSDNAEALELLHRAASMKDCRYPTDLTKGASALLKHLGSVRQAERLLQLQLIQAVDQKHAEQAVQATIDSLGMARSMSQEPVIISYFVQCVCQEFAVENLKRTTSTIPLTDTQLMQLSSAFRDEGNWQSLTRAIIGDRCTDSSAFEDFRSGKSPLIEISSLKNDEDQNQPFFLVPIYKTSGLLDLDYHAYLDAMDGFVNAAQLSPPRSIAAAHEVDAQTRSLPRSRILTHVFTRVLDRLVVIAARHEAKIRDAQSVLAIERYRLANGKLPSQLSDLVPAFLPSVPSDPFDGKPLRYKTLSKGYVVYSVGDDREDNGGAEKDSKGMSYVPGTDITFTVER